MPIQSHPERGTKAPKGSHAIDMKEFSGDLGGEQETLFARQSRLKVLSFNRKIHTLKAALMTNSMPDPMKIKDSPQPTTDAGASEYDRFVWQDWETLKIDRTEGEGEPLDFSVDETNG